MLYYLTAITQLGITMVAEVWVFVEVAGQIVFRIGDPETFIDDIDL